MTDGLNWDHVDREVHVLTCQEDLRAITFLVRSVLQERRRTRKFKKRRHALRIKYRQ